MARSTRPSSGSRQPAPTKQLKPIPTLVLCCCALLLLALTVGLTELKAEQPQVQEDVLTSSSLGEEEDTALRTAETLAPEETPSTYGDFDQTVSDLGEQAQVAPASLDGEMSEETISVEDEVLAALNDLREIFPEGMYWNHMGVEDWDEFTVTDTPCQHDLYWDTYCNGYSGGIQELFPQFEPMEQCLGFAALLSDLVFGEDAPVNTFTDYTQVRPGDHIRLELSEHSMTVLTVDEDGITVVECNSDYEHCRIRWDRSLSWEDLDAYSYEIECITRYED